MLDDYIAHWTPPEWESLISGLAPAQPRTRAWEYSGADMRHRVRALSFANQMERV